MKGEGHMKDVVGIEGLCTSVQNVIFRGQDMAANGNLPRIGVLF